MNWKELYTYDPELTELADRIIETFPGELGHIPIGSVRVVREENTAPSSQAGQKIADIRWAGPFLAFVDFYYIITIYDRNAEMFSENAVKVLLFHELYHVHPATMKCTRKHDVNGFYLILKRWGIDWQDDPHLPDILAEVTKEMTLT